MIRPNQRRALSLTQGLLLALALCALTYLLTDPIGPRNGDTWLGYVLGTLAAGVVCALLMLGARRRWWINRLGSQQQWVAAHILFGLLLIPLVLLHSGFQLGNGLHAALFVLMVLDVASGFYGLYLYQTQPKKLRGLSEGGGARKLLADIRSADTQLQALARSAGSEIGCALVSAIQRTWIPQSLRALIFNADKSHLLMARDGSYHLVANPRQQVLGQLLHQYRADKALLVRVEARSRMLQAYRKALVVEFVLGHWLKVHLQLSMAFFTLLIVHIVVVLIY